MLALCVRLNRNVTLRLCCLHYLSLSWLRSSNWLRIHCHNCLHRWLFLVLAPTNHREHHRKQARKLCDNLNNRRRHETSADSTEVIEVSLHRSATSRNSLTRTTRFKLSVDLPDFFAGRIDETAENKGDEDHDGATASSEEDRCAAANTTTDVADVVIAHCFSGTADADG